MKINKRVIIGSCVLLSLFAITGIVFFKHRKSVKPVQIVASEKNVFFNHKQVIEDIDFALNTIKKYHISCIKEIPQEVLQQRDVEIANLKESTSTIEVWKIISRILKKLHDAHSVAHCPKFLECKQLPFEIRNINDKFFCNNGDFKDAEIVEVDGIKIADLYENFKKNFSYEIEEWPHFHFFECNRFRADILALSGVDVTKPIEVTFNTDQGLVKKQFGIFRKKKIIGPISYTVDEKNNLAIFTMRDCRVEYNQIIDCFFADIARDNIKNVVVDLRSNTGGDSRVTNCFIKYLKNYPNSKKLCYGEEIRVGDTIKDNKVVKINEEILKNWMSKQNLFDGNVYILTSNLTFSSGLMFACLFSDNNLATVIGEVPGNSPECFGDCTEDFSLPNSHVVFHTTYKKFYRPDPTKDPVRLTPDIQVKAEDAMDKVYELIKHK